VFSEFVRTKLKLIEALTEAGLAAVPGHKILVQVSHTVLVHPALVGEDVYGLHGLEGLAYRLERPELIATGNQIVGTVSMPVTLGPDPVMHIELGLMVKVVQES
jgi:hypothetical protein